MAQLEVEKVTPYSTDATKKEQVREMFDNIANNYDFLNRVMSLGIDRTWRTKAVNYIGETKPQMILDLATGTGDFAIEALRLNPKQIVGLDLSEEMMEIGRKKATAHNAATILTFQQGESENMPFADNTFDAITVGFGVRNFENLEKGLSEMLRVLKPGGRVAVLEAARPMNFPFRQIFDVYYKYIMPLFGKLFSKDARAYSYLPESINAFPEGPKFVALLSKIGFKNAEFKPLTFGSCAFYQCEK
ncbi:MAG TPA: bifunctional demethylmenaquinone methyltransferase/2-methoxy-6-polyprenyl-1,4-benzoquinol methylase UbiE [Chitinophagales bacterium]